jgi:hypothetical protein
MSRWNVLAAAVVVAIAAVIWGYLQSRQARYAFKLATELEFLLTYYQASEAAQLGSKDSGTQPRSLKPVLPVVVSFPSSYWGGVVEVEVSSFSRTPLEVTLTSPSQSKQFKMALKPFGIERLGKAQGWICPPGTTQVTVSNDRFQPRHIELTAGCPFGEAPDRSNRE